MYLNHVHNTFRMRGIGAVTEQIWQDTLTSCAKLVSRLRRDQLQQLLTRGYERRFQDAVLDRYDAMSGGGLKLAALPCVQTE